jgi:hypothetical protein
MRRVISLHSELRVIIMKVDTGKLQILTAAAILVLISGGIGAYAQDQNNNSTTTTSSSSAAASQTSTTTNSSQTTTATSTSTTTTTTTTQAPLCASPAAAGQVGRLTLPISPGQSQTGTVTFAGSKGCTASITTVGGIFSVEVALRFAKPVTQYSVVLVANGTSYTLGNMVTGPEGSGQMQNQVLLKTGTYVVSIQIFDTTANPGQSTLVMSSAQGTIVSAPFPTPNASHQQTGKSNQGDDDSSKPDK